MLCIERKKNEKRMKRERIEDASETWKYIKILNVMLDSFCYLPVYLFYLY